MSSKVLLSRSVVIVMQERCQQRPTFRPTSYIAGPLPSLIKVKAFTDSREIDLLSSN